MAAQPVAAFPLRRREAGDAISARVPSDNENIHTVFVSFFWGEGGLLQYFVILTTWVPYYIKFA